MTFKRILFPTDFSRPCELAATQVAQMCWVMKSCLFLLHVFETPQISAEEELLPERDALNVWSRRRLRDFASTYLPGLTPTLIDGAGDPADCILKCISEHDIDLVMMPTRGRGRLRRALLG